VCVDGMPVVKRKIRALNLNGQQQGRGGVGGEEEGRDRARKKGGMWKD